MIVPSIDIMGGRAVQLRHGREFVLDAGDPLEWLEKFAVVGEVAVVDLDAALGTGSNAGVIRTMVRQAACRVGGGIRDPGSAREWLDAGASRIVIGTAATPEFCGALPRDRVIAAVDSVRGAVVIDGWRTATGRGVLDVIRDLAPTVGGFLLTQVEREGAMQGFDMELVRSAAEAAGDARVTAAGGITTAPEVAALDQAGVDAQVGMALYTGVLSLADAFAAPLRKGGDQGQTPISIRQAETFRPGSSRVEPDSDPAGLWPTVVSDADGRTLGLAWSSRESLRRAIEERRGIYWSRSRNAIWAKGETSGSRQELAAVNLDCDRDAIEFVVKQEGTGFCHRGTRSCFGDRFTLGALERVIGSRLAEGDGASGTRRLATEPGLLAAKLREEAGELAVAESVADIVHESADVLYLVMTKLAQSGASLADVERELAQRRLTVTRRPMQAKA